MGIRESSVGQIGGILEWNNQKCDINEKCNSYWKSNEGNKVQRR